MRGNLKKFGDIDDYDDGDAPSDTATLSAQKPPRVLGLRNRMDFNVCSSKEVTGHEQELLKLSFKVCHVARSEKMGEMHNLIDGGKKKRPQQKLAIQAAPGTGLPCFLSLSHVHTLNSSRCRS